MEVSGVEKEIIVLAISEKFNHYCVAGIDNNSGEWIRIISENDSIENAITLADMMYEDETYPQLLDVILIKCKGSKPNYFQPENIVFDSNYYWEKVGKANLNKILQIHPVENKSFIFYDGEKRIHKNELNEVCQSTIRNYSLILVSADRVVIHVDERPSRKTVRMTFNYNGIRYKGMSVTDPIIKEKYLNMSEGNYRIGNGILLVLSLGVCFSWDSCHYKLVTTVFL